MATRRPETRQFQLLKQCWAGRLTSSPNAIARLCVRTQITPHRHCLGHFFDHAGQHSETSPMDSFRRIYLWFRTIPLLPPTKIKRRGFPPLEYTTRFISRSNHFSYLIEHEPMRCRPGMLLHDCHFDRADLVVETGGERCRITSTFNSPSLILVCRCPNCHKGKRYVPLMCRSHLTDVKSYAIRFLVPISSIC